MKGATGRCVCGCGAPAVHRHHVIYRQELGRVAKEELRPDTEAVMRRELELVLDPRNLVPVAHRCHGQHHNFAPSLPMHVLPDSCFEFAAEVLGAGPGYEYLRRRYSGGDPRHDALVEEPEVVVPLTERSARRLGSKRHRSKLEQVTARDGWDCWLCGSPIDPAAPPNSRGQASLDHVVPIVKGGSNKVENLRLAHRRCNTKRGAA